MKLKLILSAVLLLGMSSLLTLNAQDLAAQQAAERLALGEQQAQERAALSEELAVIMAAQLESNNQRRAEMGVRHAEARQGLGANLMAEVAAAETIEEKRALRSSVRSQAAELKDELIAEVRALAQTLRDEIAEIKATSQQRRDDLVAKHKQEIADLVEKHKAEARGEG